MANPDPQHSLGMSLINFFLTSHLKLYLAYRWEGLLSNWTTLRDLDDVTVFWNSVRPLYLNLEPIRKKFWRAEGPLTGALNRKKLWCSTAHFHKCLVAFSLRRRKTNICSCEETKKINVTRFFNKCLNFHKNIMKLQGVPF